MIYVYGAGMPGSIEEALLNIRRILPGCNVLLVRTELAVPELLYFSLFSSLKAFQEGTNRARSVELEWACRLACEGNVATALKRTTPVGGKMAIATDMQVDKSDFQSMGITEEIKKGGTPDAKFLAEFYGIKKEALKNYDIIDLAREKMATCVV